MNVADITMKVSVNRRLAEFWRQLASAKSAVLLLDYDGTLAPFCVNREQATPYPGIRERLISIRRDTATRLVIITGRAIDVLLPLLDLAPPPEIWGCHGWERLNADGRRLPLDLPEPAVAGLRKAGCWTEAAGLEAYCERKPASLAIHWRGLSEPQIDHLATRVNSGWKPVADRYGLEVHPFNGGLELRCPGKNKGTAIRTILAEAAHTEPIAFLGDDLTDEDGFAALVGRGLGVLVSGSPRPTRARVRIEPPEELLDFLSTWHAVAPRNEAAGERGMS